MARLRVRYACRIKCLLCYLICFSLPLLWQLAAVGLIYPRKLAGTAPDAARGLGVLFPFLEGALRPLALACTPVSAQPQALRAAMAAREQSWLLFVCACALLAWLLTLLLQLLWRFSHRSPVQTARATRRAIRDYRLTLVWICLLNAAFAALVWLAGAKTVAGLNLWDIAAYFGCYPLTALAALAVSRLAAPAVLSGRHAFFKRL